MPDGRPRVNWVKRLRDRAIRVAENTNDEQFASAKTPEYNIEMKKRALTEILPDLFDVAQKYEDHFAQYGSDEEAISVSVTHTWHEASKAPKHLSKMCAGEREKPEEQPPLKRKALPALEPAKDEACSDTEVDTDIEESQTSSHSVRSATTGTRSPSAPMFTPAAPYYRAPRPPTEEPDVKVTHLTEPDAKPAVQVSPQMPARPSPRPAAAAQVSPPLPAMPSPMDFQVAQVAPTLPLRQTDNSPYRFPVNFAQVPQTTFQSTMNTAWTMPQMGISASQPSAPTPVPHLYASPVFNNETIRPMRPAETSMFTQSPFDFKMVQVDDSASAYTTSFGSTMSFDEDDHESTASAYPAISNSYMHGLHF